jgi:hypothetical protein
VARSIFDAAARDRLLARLAQLRPDSPRQWGKMTPNEMVCHLEDALRCATGEQPTRPKQTFMSNRFLRWLIIHVIPWPKGKAQTVREMQLTRPAEFNADRERLQNSLRSAASRGATAPWAVHPAFGDLRGPAYGVLIYRHFDHHLRQFGV